MSMNVSNSTPLKDVLYAFSMAQPIPNAELLDDFVRRYPTHATALTDFAISIVLDLARGGSDEEPAHEIEPTVSKAVSRAMSRFQNKLFEVQQSRDAGATLATTHSDVVNPFARGCGRPPGNHHTLDSASSHQRPRSHPRRGSCTHAEGGIRHR